MEKKQKFVNSFIEKSKAKFGDKYDYSRLNFANTRTKVGIICPEHGLQQMYIHAHLKGTGCSECGKMKSGPMQKTTEQFIKEANEIHNNLYDYSKSVYTGVHKPLTIICKLHGEFKQSPGNHLADTRCPKCNNESMYLNTEDFIKRSKAIHGDKYSYDKVVYKKHDEKVNITCPIHGDFEQTPSAHINGKQGCPECWEERRGKSRKISKEEFLERAKDIHGGAYDYSKVELGDRLKDTVTIICSEHGEFEQTPDKHLQGNGCSKCSGKYQRTTEEYITDAKKIHGNKYGYDKLVYVNNQTPITIKCSKHGYVETNPRGHINGAGCPKCFITNGEAKVENWLKSNNIKYVREYRLNGYNYRYDFYLSDLDVLVEYDGQLHFIAVDFFGGKKQLAKIQKRDKHKNELAILNNIPLIRISYLYYDVLEDRLLYKLSKIYKYRVDGQFYKGFLELCRALKLPDTTSPSGVKQYLTYKNTK